MNTSHQAIHKVITHQATMKEAPGGRFPTAHALSSAVSGKDASTNHHLNGRYVLTTSNDDGAVDIENDMQ